MKTALCICTLACLAEFAGTARAAERAGAERPTIDRRTGLFEPPLTDLRKAAERGDHADLARAASRLGPARLGKALHDADSRMVRAALEAVPLIDAGLLLLDDVLPQLSSPEEALRARAVRAIATLLANNGAERIDEWEVSGDTLDATCQSLARVTEDANENLATRLLAVQAIADAAGLCLANLKPAALMAAREPEIRRALVLALPLLPGANEILLAAAQDDDGRVAAAVGARLCQRQTKKPPLPAQPPLRQLASREGALPEDTIEILPCLAASTDPADQKAIEALEKSGGTAVREAIRRLRRASKGL